MHAVVKHNEERFLGPKLVTDNVPQALGRVSISDTRLQLDAADLVVRLFGLVVEYVLEDVVDTVGHVERLHYRV